LGVRLVSERVVTVEEAAESLRLHPKTVLRMIREGRLPAVRVGKSYRIRGADVDALAGRVPDPMPEARANAVVTVTGLTAASAERIATTLQASLTGDRGPGTEPIHLRTVFDSGRGELTVFVLASPGDAAALLSTIDLLLEPSS
jgi:excisionase family DNA binding protein